MQLTTKKYLILFLLIILSMLPTACKKSEIVIDGDFLDFQWAYSSNKCAILFQDNKTSRYHIYILDAETKEYCEKITLPDGFRPRCLAWLRDETGFFISTDELDWLVETFVYNVKNRSMIKAFVNCDEKPYGINDIVLDPQSDYWAVGFSEEGHSNACVYKGNKFMFSIPPDHPSGGISTVAWKNGRLYCESDTTLDGSGEYTDEEMISRPYELYEIDPVTRQAKKVSIDADDLANTSFDMRYKVDIDEYRDDNTFSLKITDIDT